MTHAIPPELIEHYFGLESFEVNEELLDLCGATVDVRALPTLKRRLREEDAQVPTLEARGYIRMREKSQQLIASLKPLIEALEGMSHDTPSEQLGTQHRGTS